MDLRAEATPTRPRLLRLLDALSDRRLICVVADAGSGKSAVLRDWATGRSRATAWLTLGTDHSDPARLFADLVAATDTFCPGLAEALAPELAARTDGQARDANVSATALAGALAAAWAETASAPLTLVLDDLHLLGDSAGQTLITDLVRLYPRTMQMVVAGRAPLPFSVERLRRAGQFAEISPRALLLDADETAAAFARVGIVIDPGEASVIARACGGWATAVRLAVESALSTGTHLLLEQLSSPAAAATHLTETVLASLDPLARRLLRALEALGPVRREMLARRPLELARLDVLADRGVLVHGDAVGWSLTPLAHYTVRQADALDAAARQRLLRAGCVAATETGLADDALRWALELGDDALVSAAVARFGDKLLDTLAIPALLRAAEMLPTPVGDPRIDAVLAQLFAQRGTVRRALAHIAALGSELPLPARVAHRIATAFWVQGEATHAADVLARADDHGEPTDLSLVAAARATIAWSRGDGEAGRALADEALLLATASGDESALASAWVAQALVAVLTGDMVRNHQAYVTALAHARAAGDVLTEVRIRCNVGSQLNETGRYRAALGELAEAIRLGEATGQSTRVALARQNQGDSRLGLGQLDKALQDYDAALAIWSAAQSPMADHAHLGRADTLARRGDTSRSAAAYREAIALSERFGNSQVLVPALAGLARVELTDDPAAASDLVNRALAEPAPLGSLAAYLAAGWVALCQGDPGQAADWARQARTEAARRLAPSALAEALTLSVLADPGARPGDGRLSEAGDIWSELGNQVGAAELDLARAWLAGDARSAALARSRLRGIGIRDSAVRVAGPLAVLAERQDAELALQTLGTFAVYRDGSAVPGSAWQSRKARDLMKILAARRGKTITREALADLLWPDAAPDSAGNRLSVALSTARSVLDPERDHPADRFIVADRGAVRLDLRTVHLDVEDFAEHVRAALSAAGDGNDDAVHLLERAAAAYPGDFCEDDPYEVWATQPRDELRAQYHQVLRALARTLAAADLPDAAVPWLITLLGADPYDESTHLRLVRTLVRAGRHGDARRSYRTYTERMSEIDVEPAAFPQTRASRAGDRR